MNDYTPQQLKEHASRGLTTQQLIEVAEMAAQESTGLHILYVWPAQTSLPYALNLFQSLLPDRCAMWRGHGRYSFEVLPSGSIVEFVPASRSPRECLAGRNGYTITVVIDHAVDSRPWNAEIDRLAAKVEAMEASRP